MRKLTGLKKMLWLLVLPMFFLACEDKMEEHYKVPDWLKGNAWEVLEEQGNYTIFLKGIELAGFKPMVEGKSILTVMAPNDEAFSKYLKLVDRNSIENFTKEELVKLIGFHLMYYSYGYDRLVNFRPEGDGITNEEAGVNAGLYNKFRTKSIDPVSYEEMEDPANPGKIIKIAVYHNERLLPVFSKRMFETKKIDAKYNYEYFYPQSQCTVADGFNVSNASVIKYETVTENGYIYNIDRVLEPLETVYTEMLKRKDRYSLFAGLYDQFRVPQKNDDLTKNYGNGEDLYQILHGELPPIACEWTSTDFRNIALNSLTTQNVFAPSDAAFNLFFDQYWKKGRYASLADVDEVALSYILRNHTYTGPVIFPEEITAGKLVSSYDGQPLTFDVEKVSDRIMCSNGIFYGLGEIKVPVTFRAVTGAAFMNKDFSNFLYMLTGSGMLRSLVSNDSRFTALMPSNDQLLAANIWKQDGSLVTYSTEGEIVALGDGYMSNSVSMHFSTSDNDLLKGEKQVIKTNSSYNYWYIKDRKITSNELFNSKVRSSSIDPFVPLEEVAYEGGDWTNGKVYRYSGSVFTPASSESLIKLLAMALDENYPYYEFGQLLQKAGLASVATQTINFISELRFLVFIPSNQAVRNALAAGNIPGLSATGAVTDQQALEDWLKYYFVRMDESALSDYPYIGTGINKACVSYAKDSYRTNLKLNIMDDGARISISNSIGERVYVVGDYDQFPFVYPDGCFHIIEDVLQYKK